LSVRCGAQPAQIAKSLTETLCQDSDTAQRKKLLVRRAVTSADFYSQTLQKYRRLLAADQSEDIVIW